MKKHSHLINDYHLLSFDSLDSTNEEGKRLARGGGCHGAVIWAKEQTAGRGRLDRNWVSAQGNLFVSVLLKPEKPLVDFGQLSFVAAMAVHDSLEALVPQKATLECKWPNDILLNQKKVGGILLESFQTENGGGHWVVVGVGVNVDSSPPRTEFPATCLKDAGVELVSAKIILSRFIHHFIDRYDAWNTKGFASVRKDWTDNAWGLGKRVCVRLEGNNIEGVADSIDGHGALELKLDNGKKQHIQAGDVFPAEAPKKKKRS